MSASVCCKVAEHGGGWGLFGVGEHAGRWIYLKHGARELASP